MLYLTLPSDAPAEGQCRINGQASDYRLDEGNGTLSFRSEGHEGWDRRRIISRSSAGGLTTYFCASEDGGGSVTQPVVSEDGHVRLLTSWLGGRS